MMMMMMMMMYRLLDVLAGRTEHKGISGYLLVDGKDQPHNFKCMTGYVVQVKDHVLTLDLTLYRAKAIIVSHRII